jgi:hypothetical protein
MTFILKITSVLVGIATLAFAAPGRTAEKPPLGGDQLLARAVGAGHLQSYAVPVQFAVHLHKPIGMRVKAEGVGYFRAPAQTALAITKASGILGGLFKGAYRLDIVPQAWPVTYHVVSVSRQVVGGVPLLQLNAQPRANAGDITQVVFSVNASDLQPVAVDWRYSDQSSVRVAYVYGRVGQYTLPQQAAIVVDKPHYKLEADATYGTYALNTPISPAVFTSAK